MRCLAISQPAPAFLSSPAVPQLAHLPILCAPTAEDPSGRTWQPWADHLVGMVVTALPWAGEALQEAAPEQLEQLMVAVQTYVEGRPMQEDPELRPLYGAASEDDQRAARCVQGMCASVCLGRWGRGYSTRCVSWAWDACSMCACNASELCGSCSALNSPPLFLH